MSTVRFALVSAAVFAVAFIGMLWGNKSFPVMAMKVDAPKQAEAPKPVEVPQKIAPLPSVDDSAGKAVRKDVESPKPVRSNADKERDKFRLELLQASIGYKLSPCDDAMKKNLVSAVTNYTRAFQAALNCKAGVDGCPATDSDRANAAREAFKTPADIRVQKELREAYEQGGITKADFPSVGGEAFQWTGQPFGSSKAACVIAREAENRR
jgi:hypothetical protein